ncbi:MAG: LacI family DNA-binding transcriptional regulator [Planctomycetota bacterium]
MRSNRPTIVSVAAEAGVSKSAVSDIANRGLAEVYPVETRKRVYAAMQKLGYQPHRAAQSLRRGRSNRVGVFITRGFANPFYARMFDLLRIELAQHGLGTDLVSPPEVGSADHKFHALVLPGDIDAMIVGPLYGVDSDLIKQLNSHNWGDTRLVTFGTHQPDAATEHHIQLNDQEAGRAMAQHLLGLGHRRIAFFGAYADRIKQEMAGTVQVGIEQEIQQANDAQLTHLWPCDDDGTYESAYTAARGLVAEWQATSPTDRPTGIGCKSDQIAMALMRAFLDGGLRLPQDVSIVGFDNVPEGQFTWPALSSVDPGLGNRIHQVGLATVASDGSASSPEAERDDEGGSGVRVVVRESCGKPDFSGAAE